MNKIFKNESQIELKKNMLRIINKFTLYFIFYLLFFYNLIKFDLLFLSNYICSNLNLKKNNKKKIIRK